MKLTLRECSHMHPKDAPTAERWYVIERAEHDGREWMEEYEDEDGGGARLMRSARISDACVEGVGIEMLAIAEAIENRGKASFKRCAVIVHNDKARFGSPRNSRHCESVPIADALDLAKHIRAVMSGEVKPEES